MTDQISNLLALLHRDDVPNPQALLVHALPDLVASIPDATSACVYRVAFGGLAIWHNMDEDDVAGTYITLATESPYQQALVTGLPTIDPADNTMIAPLRGQSGEIFALLAVRHSKTPSADLIPPLAEQLAYFLYSKHLENLLKRQTDATRELNSAESIYDVITILAQHLLGPSQYVAYNEFEYNGKDLSAAYTTATANRKQLYKLDEPIAIEPTYMQTVYDELLAHGDMLISDTGTDIRLKPADRKWLEERNAHSTYCIPLYLEDRLHAFIAFVDSKGALAFATDEKHLYLNLAQQSRAIIEKNQHLARTEMSLEQTQLLYDLVGNLMQAETIPQILEILYKYVGEGTRNISFSEFIYDNRDLIADIRIRYVITDGRAREVNVPWFEDYPENEIRNFMQHAREIEDDLEIIEDYDRYKDNLLVLRRLQQQGINSTLTIPIMQDRRRVQQITLAWSEAHTFDASLVQLMRTAKSQIGLVLKNRDLLTSIQEAAKLAERQASRLQQIADFGQAMQASLVISEILNTTLEYGRKIIEADYVAVMTYDRGVDTLRLVARQWKAASDLYSPGQLLKEAENTIAEQAWRKRDLVQVEKLGADWEHKHPLMEELATMLAVPLISGGILSGVIEVGKQARGPYLDTDLLAFQQMANQLAVAFANAEAYAQSQKLARNKGAANEIIAQLQQQADVSSILRVTAQELGQALNARRVRIRLGMNDKRTSGD